ncbi:PepSY-like domain-containing protein [Marixanthomonas ophiurae]|uniref:Beta-lactamase-inhibitor-like PepSY-like domain-containing protein n=1 Tax=Marixanthomonas ophiurae TaxID=387659 RepID=A0A3E1QAB4_9FLAO|nr:PepSY-like domain-containing protein [Marixanthomonas ophiurae]RFN59061.1 hypothetical protein DZ858_02995 [Marixanthomonas ophiurae]
MFKKTLLLITIALISFACESDIDIDENQVPSVVVNALKVSFLNTTDREWEKSDEFFIVEFEKEDVDYTAKLNSKGEILKYKYEVNNEQLPEAVKKSISLTHPDAEIDDVELLFIDNKEYYQIEIEKSFKDLKKVIDLKGQVTNISYWD